MRKINYISALTIVAAMLISCGKDGAVGPAGASGANGATGATGSANVIYSDWITPTAFTKETIDGIYHYYATIPAPAITQAVLDNGTVLVYGILNGYGAPIWPSNGVSELPITLFYQYNGVNNTDIWSAFVAVGSIKIDLFNENNSFSTSSFVPTANQFRYVVIPGGVHTLSSINIHDYKQVVAALHLKD